MIVLEFPIVIHEDNAMCITQIKARDTSNEIESSTTYQSSFSLWD